MTSAATAQVCGSHLVVEVQHVGAVSPLGEDDGVLLLPLQTATLGNLTGLRGDVVLRRHRRMLDSRYDSSDSSTSTSAPLPLLLVSTAPLDRGDVHYNLSIVFNKSTVSVHVLDSESESDRL